MNSQGEHQAKMRAKTGVMGPQAKENQGCQQTPEGRERRGTESPSWPSGETARRVSPRTFETVNGCFLHHSGCGTWLQQPWGTRIVTILNHFKVT